MQRLFFTLIILSTIAMKLHGMPVDTIVPRVQDSAWWHFLSLQQQGSTDVLLFQESSREEEEHFASPLHAERDPFLQLSLFQFGVLRFRPRGYDAAYSSSLVNGLCMNDPVTGSPGWQLWSGLQPVMKQATMYIEPQFSPTWCASLGTTEETDMRAHVQRARLQVGVAQANRSYQHRVSVVYASGTNKKGWSIASQGSVRWAAENHMEGCGYLSGNYYLAFSKQLAHKAILSFTGFGVWQRMSRQAAVTLPAVQLFGQRYNPNWGMQDQAKRNAAEMYQHRPVAILSYQKEWHDRSNLLFSMGVVTGKRTDTRLDWFNASDPRPDYYRYLPAFQSDSALQAWVIHMYADEPMPGQINWQALYDVNRQSYATIMDANGIPGNTVTGKAAHYLLEERVDQLFRYMASAALYCPVGQQTHVSAGWQFQYQRNHQYKIAKDLLGADFHVNWNPFAPTTNGYDLDAIQFDLAIPNRIVLQGQRYGHDHSIVTRSTQIWTQVQQQGKRMDLLFSLHMGKQEIYRHGHVRNGAFPLSSLGKGRVLHFVQVNPVLSFTYKINGRNFLQITTQQRGRAPAVQDIYLSPRMQHIFQDNLRNETVSSIVLSYMSAYPQWRSRISLFATSMQEGMRVMSFYHDGYRNFVNYAIRGIGRRYLGVEAGSEWKLTEQWKLLVAGTVGTHTYTTRQEVTVTLDTDNWLLEKTQVYSKGFRVPGVPHMATGIGIQYARNGLLMHLHWNHFRSRWLDFNPYRRTYDVLEGIPEGSDHWRSIVDQVQLPAASLMNLFVGKNINLNKRGAKRMSLFCSLSVNNLLNRTDIISGGYEQLRFDAEVRDVNKFPPKLFWLQGRNYALTISFNL